MMEYFDKDGYNQIYNRYAKYSDQLNDAAILFEEIAPFDEPTFKIFLDRYDRREKLIEIVEAPIISDLDKLGVKNDALRKSQIANATAVQKEVIEEIEKTLKPNQIYIDDLTAFEFRDGEIVISQKWESELRDRFTIKSDTPAKKQFAKLVNEFQESYEGLKSLLPPHVDVFSYEMEVGKKSVFVLKRSGAIYRVNESILKEVR